MLGNVVGAQGEAAAIVVVVAAAVATIVAQEANIASDEARGEVRSWEARERRPAMHPGERCPVDEVVLQCWLIAVVGVADGRSEEEEAVARGEDDGLRPEISRLEGGAVDAEVGNAWRTGDAKGGLHLVAGACEILGGRLVGEVGDVGFEIE